MQSCVVRVYRRNPDNKDEVAGIIGKVGTRHQTSFQNLFGLQEYFERLINTDDSEEKQIACFEPGSQGSEVHYG